MGSVLIKTNHSTKITYLKEVNMFGRHWTSDFQFQDDSRVPMIWLEIRWYNSQWCWRVLNRIDATTGNGKFVSSTWRKFSKIIRLQKVVSIELVSNSPPQTLLEDIESKKILPLIDFDLLRRTKKGDVTFEGVIYQNMDLITINKKVYKLWIPSLNLIDTDGGYLDIGSKDCVLDIDFKILRATLTVASNSIVLEGESVRVLTTYAISKLNGDSWLSTEDAFKQWITLGGKSDSEQSRMAWERNKIRGKLVEQKVENAGKLFYRRREGVDWLHSLTLSKDNIYIENFHSE